MIFTYTVLVILCSCAFIIFTDIICNYDKLSKLQIVTQFIFGTVFLILFYLIQYFTSQLNGM